MALGTINPIPAGNVSYTSGTRAHRCGVCRKVAENVHTQRVRMFSWVVLLFEPGLELFFFFVSWILSREFGPCFAFGLFRKYALTKNFTFTWDEFRRTSGEWRSIETAHATKRDAH